MDKTIYVYTDVTPHNGHVEIFGHMLAVDGDNWEDTDYGRRTYIGYTRNQAVLEYISKVIGEDDSKDAKIVIKKF